MAVQGTGPPRDLAACSPMPGAAQWPPILMCFPSFRAPAYVVFVFLLLLGTSRASQGTGHAWPGLNTGSRGFRGQP